ncbi:peroxidase 27-like [Olea europaea subsp. europaea]|uniref:Peroxidase n=1 Tax=Olea europaea subsp. europaea TaxID=158383 RepID=A0A8S0R3Z7_OLEEU|nr:peroxidase 27-like [Olea europaea subsp. europaea]
MASISTLFFQLITLAFAFNIVANGQSLKVGYYQETCPDLEPLVKEIVDQVISISPTLAPPLLRMHFHDCFVRGCDGSVLLESPAKKYEKDADSYLSLRGFEIIDQAKAAAEKVCPGVVSCADILALVARDVTVAVKGPFWEVETGRRDGRVSIKSEALHKLLAPFSNISTLKKGFKKRGLSVKDLVVLSGGHTIGISHCSSFHHHLYNFTGRFDTDPSLDSKYVKKLKMKCKPRDQNSIVEMDPGSYETFDESYFRLVAKRRGLFESDVALLDDIETKAYLKFQALSHGSTFFEDFGESMVKMGRINVLTDKEGEIRSVCTKVY